MIRLCPKCKTETERSKNGSCKPCAAIYRIANASRATELRRIRHKASPEKYRAVQYKWNEQNKERIRKAKLIWLELNKEDRKIKRQATHDANPEQRRNWTKSWATKNHSLKRTYKHNRKSKEKENGGKLSKGLQERLFKLQKGMCPCCGMPLGKDYHMDHIFPTCMGGQNIDSNIQLLRSICNLQKSSNDPVDFMRAKGFLI